MDCPAQPLIYNTRSNNGHSALTVTDVLDSCVPQRSGDMESQPKVKKSVSLDNSQVCFQLSIC